MELCNNDMTKSKYRNRNERIGKSQNPELRNHESLIMAKGRLRRKGGAHSAMHHMQLVGSKNPADPAEYFL
jgi:hypothetical protein